MEQQLDFSSLDVHFARFLTRLCGGNIPELYYAAALLSRQVAGGSVCLDLKVWENRRIAAGDDRRDVFAAPKLKDWMAKLSDCQVVGPPGEFRPLIMDDQCRLYLYRYWEYERRLADGIQRLAFRPPDATMHRPDARRVERLFSESCVQEADWQKIAALTACFRPFLVISGSPGTGKTTTVARVLALLMEQMPPSGRRVALAAPTGKAAARLQDAIRSAKQNLDCDCLIKACIPEHASTVHRLLGSLPESSTFRHHQGNPLPADVVVVDEASMLDLPLLSKLVQAMPAHAGLILLGDKNQLASVEAGAVLGDICGDVPANLFSRRFLEEILPYTGVRIRGHVNITEKTGIHDCIVELRTNYRFTGESVIGRVGAAVARGEGAGLLRELASCSDGSFIRSSLPEPRELEKMLRPVVLEGFGRYLGLIHAGASWGDVFEAFERFRILCALRQGPFGVEAVNRHVEKILETEQLIRPGRPCYCGQPLMITRNSPELRLYNGDVGLILADPDQTGGLSAVFADGSSQPRRFPPRRLPEYETVYAMTVHKSQGSEFDAVLLVLSDRDVPILTRELVYTGITRARRQVRLWSADDVLMASLSRCIQRTSGLRDALWKNTGSS